MRKKTEELKLSVSKMPDNLQRAMPASRPQAGVISVLLIQMIMLTLIFTASYIARLSFQLPELFKPRPAV